MSSRSPIRSKSATAGTAVAGTAVAAGLVLSGGLPPQTVSDTSEEHSAPPPVRPTAADKRFTHRPDLAGDTVTGANSVTAADKARRVVALRRQTQRAAQRAAARAAKLRAAERKAEKRAAERKAAEARAARERSSRSSARSYAGDPRGIAQSMMASRYGWGAGEFSCLDSLWARESGWNIHAANASGAYGIPQALPGSKMASAGEDWQSNPATQVAWGLSYIDATYGTPCSAWSAFQSQGWY